MTVNDVEVTREIEGRLLLVHFLRDHLALTGTHWGCDTSNCGTCVVLMDGQPVKSCTVLAAMAAGHDIRTVEGLAAEGELTDVQRAFVEQGAVQCGFCIPGMVVAIHDLLDRNVRATELELREAISGNLCRCTGYGRIFAAFRQAQEGRINAGA